jgi:hypothetical protein
MEDGIPVNRFFSSQKVKKKSNERKLRNGEKTWGEMLVQQQ